MRGLLGWLGAFVASAGCWKLGSYVGVGTAWVLACVAGGVGLYAGRRWFDNNLR